jgi:hypothetical protein
MNVARHSSQASGTASPLRSGLSSRTVTDDENDDDAANHQHNDDDLSQFSVKADDVSDNETHAPAVASLLASSSPPQLQSQRHVAATSSPLKKSASAKKLAATKLVFDDVDNIYVLGSSNNNADEASTSRDSFASSDAPVSSDGTVATVPDDDEDIVIRLPIYDGEFSEIRPDLSSSEPMTAEELRALRVSACSFYNNYVYDRSLANVPKKSLDVEPVGASAGAFDALDRSIVLRIIGHTSALSLVALSRTCHHLRHLCRALVRARYCNQRGLSVKLRLPRADIWRLTVEADVVNESTLDDFEWLKTLGTGSFGRVRLVRHRRTGGYYAMKCLKKAMLLEHEQQDRLYWEKDVVSTLEHPFVVQFFRTFQDSIYVYFLFEFAAGGEIFHLICEHGRLQSRVAKFYAAETLLVLKYFATLNVVYRDIKPENLLLSAEGHIKFTDFGFAAVLAAGEQSKAFLASAEYISPEMILGKGYGLSVDMWSFGVLLYELLVGLPPFVGALTDISYNIFNTDIDFPVRVDAEAKDLILKLLVLDPARRLTPEQAMQHPWFAGINWHMVYLRMYPPPYVPPVKSQGDSSQFNDYAEENQTQLTPVDVEFEEFG